MNTLLVFLGAGIGGVLRYKVSSAIEPILGQNFPYGTLIVNITGCFIIGFLFIFLLNRYGENTSQLRSFLLIGFLGGYTTFSAFSMDTFILLEKGEWLKGILNVIFSIVLCMLAVCMGVFGAKNL